MATFSDQEVTNIAEIIGVNIVDLRFHVNYYASQITPEAYTRVIQRVTDFQAIEDDTTDVKPNLKNFGAEISADKKRSLIRQRIVTLLFLDELCGGGTSKLIRS